MKNRSSCYEPEQRLTGFAQVAGLIIALLVGTSAFIGAGAVSAQSGGPTATAGKAVPTLPSSTRDSVSNVCLPSDRCCKLLSEVRTKATKAAPAVRITCSLTLSPGDVITKRLIFEGPDASGVTVEGNGATVDGGPGTFNYTPNQPEFMVMINSRTDVAGRRWSPPENVTLRNLKIRGSVGIWGITGPEQAPTIRDWRQNAPRNVVLDRVTITGVPCENNTGAASCVPLYLFSGVNNFQLLNSEINGSTTGTNIYLDDMSHRNTFRNNRIEAKTVVRDREVMAIDGSSENIIVNNHFSALNHGGIEIYRNCGEGGSKRQGTPSYNAIVNNFFYYDKYDGDERAILVGSRRCPPEYAYKAQFNVVMQNQIRKRSVSDMIKVGNPAINQPNYVGHNQTVAERIERKAGCYNRGTGFLLDGQFADHLDRPNSNGAACSGRRETCRDGVLQRSTFACQDLDFECQATGNNSGCLQAISVPAGKQIVAAKAACNLEFGTVAATDLTEVLANRVKVLRASDDVSKGRCTLGTTSIRSGQAAINGVDGRSELSFGCREHDANGGDCHIKGKVYYR